MKESHIQTLFSKAIEKTEIFGMFELKLSKKTCLPYAMLKPHQEEALLKACESDVGLFHKLSDFPIFAGSKMRFNKPKPFDCFRVRGLFAFVAICFYIPRKPKKILLIDIRKFVKAREEDKRKSLTKIKAEEIADFTVDL